MKHTLLFDLDGTLSDNRPGICASIRHACVRLGRESPDDAVLHGCVGPPLRETFARLLGADHAMVERAIEHYRERFATLGWSENEVYPGIADMLARLREAEHALYVCTSKPRL
ncbi:MAG TPA: HAD hydrolase-like protein, partial [Casimicrobiaceae bacterium]|nr:HAD hydrolase-like protein [Casimicrobiaceae bacterium]